MSGILRYPGKELGGWGVGIPNLGECRVNDITSHQLAFEKTTVVKNSTAF